MAVSRDGGRLVWCEHPCTADTQQEAAMTTQVTRQGEEARQGIRGVVGMTAVTLALVGVAALWQLRPSGEETSPGGGDVTTVTADSGIPSDQEAYSRWLQSGDGGSGTVDLYRDQARNTAWAAETGNQSRCGLDVQQLAC